MSQKKTSPSSIELMRNSLYELFHPESKRRLVNYYELSALVDWEELKLVDFNQLKLIDVPQMRFFLRYIGAMALFVGFLGAFVLTVFLAQSKNSTYKSSSASNSTPSIVQDIESGVIEIDSPIYALYGKQEDGQMPESEEPGDGQGGPSSPAPAPKPVQVRPDGGVVPSEPQAKPSVPEQNEMQKVPAGEKTFNKQTRTILASNTQKEDLSAYLYNREGVSDLVETSEVDPVAKVLEVQGKKPVVLGETSACSFAVDKKYYSDNSNYSLNGKNNVYVCAHYPTEAVSSKWVVTGVNGSDTQEIPQNANFNGCANITNVRASSTLSVSVYDKNNSYVEMCTLNFSR